MLCKWCNKEVENNAKFCPNCGGDLVSFKSQINEQVTNNYEQPIPKPGVNTYTQPQNTVVNNREEKVNVGLVILSIFIPLAGLIIFLSKKDNDKKTAKASGIAALISFGVNIVIIVMFFISAFISVNSVIDSAREDLEDYVNDENIEVIIPEDNYNTDTDNNDVDNVVVTLDWKTYEIRVNDTTLKLPCTYSELSIATSSEMQSSYLKSYLQAGYYALVNMYKNENLALYIEVLNDTGADILYADGKITRVSQTKYHSSVGADVITFPGGLRVGQEITRDEIVNLFGEPSKVDNYSSDGYISDTYTYVEDTLYTTTNYYKVKVVNGIIDELTLDNRNYN